MENIEWEYFELERVGSESWRILNENTLNWREWELRDVEY